MRKHFIYIGLLLLVATIGWASYPDTLPLGTTNYSVERGLDAGNYEAISPGDTATGITAGLLTSSGVQAKEAYITVEDQAIHFTVDGTTPTQTGGTDVGHVLAAGNSISIFGYNNIANFKCIDQTSGNVSKVKVTLFY